MIPDHLERRIVDLAGGINLRPTLDKAAALGELLHEAKALVEHGQWLGWLKKVGLRPRPAQTYMQLSNTPAPAYLGGGLTIEKFLEHVRDTKRRERLAERARLREEVAARRGRLADGIRLVNRDCRQFKWPDQVDHVVTDPPWSEMASYEWLATFAAEYLRPGGLMMVQCGTAYLAEVVKILEAGGLRYVWTLAIAYQQTNYSRPFRNWSPGWRPVLVYSRGEPEPRPPLTSDIYTVPALRHEAEFHDWQQPLAPIRHWVERLTRPGETVADPFTGSGTTAVACLGLGRRFVGTEIDKASFKVARGRILEAGVTGG